MKRVVPIVLDIETEPDKAWLDSTAEAFMAELAKRDPPGNMKKGETIQKWYEELFETAPKKRVEDAALSPIDGRITAIAVAPLWDDMEPIALVDRADEAALILEFLLSVSQCARGEPAILAGYNIAQFDLPFLVARSAMHGIRLPSWWPDVSRRYGICLDAFDVLGRQGELSAWLQRFDLPPKTGDGSQCGVYTDEELRGYVQNDVRVERLLLRRLAAVSPPIRATEPEPSSTP